jgi:hypothetical protein
VLHDPPIATYAIVILIGLAMNYLGNRSSVLSRRRPLPAAAAQGLQIGEHRLGWTKAGLLQLADPGISTYDAPEFEVRLSRCLFASPALMAFSSVARHRAVVGTQHLAGFHRLHPSMTKDWRGR